MCSMGMSGTDILSRMRSGSCHTGVPERRMLFDPLFGLHTRNRTRVDSPMILASTDSSEDHN